MPAKGHGDASGLHGRLVVPQLVDPLLLQEEGLLGVEKRGHSVASRCLPAPAAGLRGPLSPRPSTALSPGSQCRASCQAAGEKPALWARRAASEAVA